MVEQEGLESSGVQKEVSALVVAKMEAWPQVIHMNLPMVDLRY